MTNELEVFGGLIKCGRVFWWRGGLFLAEKTGASRSSESSSKESGWMSRAAQGATKAAR